MPPSPSLSDWIGTTQDAMDILVPRPAQMAASILANPPPIGPGAVLPALWHWLYFPEIVSLAASGSDGHPQRGDFLPPVALPRRMWAGGALRFHSPLRLGETVHRRSRIANVEEKVGKSGSLCFVTVEHQLFSGQTLCIEESQDIVYRENTAKTAPVSPVKTELPPAQHREWVTPTSVSLFRFSAATSNSHRIHYDRPYAMEEEHYPGLVVHGPLIALMLADLAERYAGRHLASFEFRALQPLFDTEAFSISIDIAGDTADFRAETALGSIAMKATAQFRAT